MIIKPELVLSVVKDIKAEIGEFKKAVGPVAVLRSVCAFVPRIVHKVEAVSDQLRADGVDIKSADKKRIALDILFALVPLPAWLPRKAAEMVAGFIIDSAVSAVNKHIGK